MGLTHPFWKLLKTARLVQQGIPNKDFCCFGCFTLHKKWWWMYYFKLRDLNVWGGEYPNSLACYETISIVSDQLNFTRFCAWVDLTRWNEKCNFLGWDYQTDSAISSSLSIETNPSSPLSFWGHQSWIQFLETLIGFFPFQGEEFAAHGSLFGGNGTRFGGRVSLYVSKCTTKFLPNPYLHKIDIINMKLEVSI